MKEYRNVGMLVDETPYEQFARTNQTVAKRDQEGVAA